MSYSSADRDWDFLPSNIEKFEFFDELSFEFMLIDDDFGFSFKESDYELNIERPTHPLSVKTKTNSKNYEIYYLLSFDRVISFSSTNTIADQQDIDCYTFYQSITVGFCDDSQLTIRNSKDKYKPLGDNKLLLIDGENLEYKITFLQAVNNNFFDNYSLYLSQSENSFDWLSPIEELTIGFIASLTYKGSTIGELATREIARFPQREPYTFHKAGITVYKKINLFNSMNFFYDLNLVYVKTRNYLVVLNQPKYNLKLESGIIYNINNFDLKFSGTIYQNNLYGFNDISYNQKTEHHFNSNFASINVELKYSF